MTPYSSGCWFYLIIVGNDIMNLFWYIKWRMKRNLLGYAMVHLLSMLLDPINSPLESGIEIAAQWHMNLMMTPVQNIIIRRGFEMVLNMALFYCPIGDWGKYFSNSIWFNLFKWLCWAYIFTKSMVAYNCIDLYWYALSRHGISLLKSTYKVQEILATRIPTYVHKVFNIQLYTWYKQSNHSSLKLRWRDRGPWDPKV